MPELSFQFSGPHFEAKMAKTDFPCQNPLSQHLPHTLNIAVLAISAGFRPKRPSNHANGSICFYKSFLWVLAVILPSHLTKKTHSRRSYDPSKLTARSPQICSSPRRAKTPILLLFRGSRPIFGRPKLLRFR